MNEIQLESEMNENPKFLPFNKMALILLYEVSFRSCDEHSRTITEVRIVKDENHLLSATHLICALA